MEGSAEAGFAPPRVPWGGPPGHAQAGGARGDGAQRHQHPQQGAPEARPAINNNGHNVTTESCRKVSFTYETQEDTAPK